MDGKDLVFKKHKAPDLFLYHWKAKSPKRGVKITLKLDVERFILSQ